jgi:hypothetical protein
MDQIKSIQWPFPNQSLLINPGFLTWGKALRDYDTDGLVRKWHESPAIGADLVAAGLPANLES